MKQRVWILAVAVLFVAATGVQAGDGLIWNLLDVHVDGGSTGQPAVTLATDGQVTWESFRLEDPDRLVLDLQGVVSHLEDHSYTVGAAGVIRVRAGQYRAEPNPVSRIVFDLEYPVNHEVVRNEDGSLTVLFGPAMTPEQAAAWPPGPPSRVEEAVPAEAPASKVASVDPAPSESPASVPEAAAEEPVAPIGTPVPVSEMTTAAAVGPEAVEAPVPVVEEPAPAREEIRRQEVADAGETPYEDRAVNMEAIDRLLDGAPELADMEAPAEEEPVVPASFSTKRIVTDANTYTGKKVSFNLVDADIKQVFRLFHDISGLNFVLDPSVNGRVTIVLDNVPWDQALDLILKNNGLDKVLENNVIRIASTSKLAQEAAQRKQLKEAKELEVEPVTITRTLSYAKAADVEKVIKNGGVLTDRGKVIIDERTNTLIISDVPKRIEPLDQLISTLDTETPQVMIEARIIETSRTFSRDIGVQWGFTAAADAAHGTATGLSFPRNAKVGYGLNLGSSETGDVSGTNALAMSFGNVIDSFTLDIALDALETSGQGRILSSPKIATQNNEEAEIEQGVRIPVVNTTATEINVEFVSASLKLTVTPQITAEGTIILEITVENNSPDFNNTVGDVPPINTQRAQTKVLVADGGTTVIGGIFTVNEGSSETGVPWFRKIPVFGWLFKQTSLRNENRELLIFITPKIMKIG